jgi:Asp/Glu/hydantoin racemase
MSSRIIVINPNSTRVVTEGISTALEPLRMAGGPAIDCVTLAEGPPGIESQQDADSVIQPLCRYIEAHHDDAGAFVIACYSDPGLHSAREVTRRPVFGMAECGMLTALTRGERFGVISILARSIPRHLRYIRSTGLQHRFAGDRAIGLGVVELSDDETVLQRMSEVGRQLCDIDGADVIIMGCAGMARMRERLEQNLGVAVIEPVQAAVTMAIGAVCR